MKHKDRNLRPEAAPVDLALDEDLSALVDGELDPERAALLRARVESDPELALRLQRFEAVSAALREREAPALRQDLASQLADRIARDSGGAIDDGALDFRAASLPPARSVVARLMLRRWVPFAAAATAAGLVIYLIAGGGAPPQAPDVTQVAKSEIAPPAESSQLLAAEASLPARELEPEADAPVPLGEELDLYAVALDLDAVGEDFELIDNLELLEFLAALEDEGQRG